MIAREAVLNHPQIVELLRERFVCLAVDNADNLNLTPADRAWLKNRGGEACTQGMSVFTPGGDVLGTGGGYEPMPVKQMLEQALTKFTAERDIVIEDTSELSTNAIPKPPAGGLVLTVTWKLLPGARAQSSPTSGDGVYDQTFLHSLGVDRLWVRADEAKELAEGGLPDSLRRRMAPHLKMVLPGGASSDGVTLKDGLLSGGYTSKQGDRAAALGYVESREGKVTRFDLIVKGFAVRATDHGFSAAWTVVPVNEKVPAALCFTLADPSADITQTPPYRARHEGYLK